MGWATLTLRKQFLKTEHNDYELQLLQISSERRQLSRSKQTQLSEISADKEAQLAAAKESTEYTNKKNAYNDALKSGDTETAKTLAEEFTAAKAEYDEQKERINQVAEDEQQELEAETTEKENDLDTRQTQLEAMNESITQELQSVSESISSDIQNSTIKLS